MEIKAVALFFLNKLVGNLCCSTQVCYDCLGEGYIDRYFFIFFLFFAYKCAMIVTGHGRGLGRLFFISFIFL